MKGPGLSVGGHLPGSGKGGDEMELIVGLYQGIVQLVDGPLDGAVLGPGGVEGGDAIAFVIYEDFFVCVRGRGMARYCRHKVNCCKGEVQGIDYLHRLKFKYNT